MAPNTASDKSPHNQAIVIDAILEAHASIREWRGDVGYCVTIDELFEDIVRRLAGLTTAEYALRHRAAAKWCGLSVAELDDFVKIRREVQP